MASPDNPDLDKLFTAFVKALHKEVQHHGPFFWTHPKQMFLWKKKEGGVEVLLLRAGSVSKTFKDTWKQLWYVSEKYDEVEKFGMLYKSRAELLEDDFEPFHAKPANRKTGSEDSETYKALRRIQTFYRNHHRRQGPLVTAAKAKLKTQETIVRSNATAAAKEAAQKLIDGDNGLLAALKTAKLVEKLQVIRDKDGSRVAPFMCRVDNAKFIPIHLRRESLIHTEAVFF